MKNKIFRVLILIILILGIYNITSEASYLSNDPVVNSGETFSITVTSTEELENYDLAIVSYTGLEFTGCSASNGATVGKNTGKIAYAKPEEGTKNLGTFSFKAPSVTDTANYKVVFDINGVKNESNVTVKCSETNNQESENTEEDNTQDQEQSSETTNESKQTAAEPNPELASITVYGKTYKNPSNDFTIPSVDAEVSDINIEAVAKDENAKVTVIGNTGLKEGKTNTITITVSTDNGENKYYIRVPKSVKLDDEQPNIIEENTQEDKKEEKQEEVKPALKSLKIKSFSLTPKFSTDVYSYTVEVDMDKKDVEKLDITAVANDDKFKVEISGNEKFVEGENIVNITVSNEDDTETATYQIKVNKIVKSSEVVGKTQYIQEEKATSASTVEIIIIAIAVIGAILGIIFAVVEYRYTNNNDDDDDNENDRFFNFDKQMDFKEKDENTGYIEELYHSQDIEEKYDDYEEDKHKKKSKGKHF